MVGAVGDGLDVEQSIAGRRHDLPVFDECDAGVRRERGQRPEGLELEEPAPMKTSTLQPRSGWTGRSSVRTAG